MLVDKRNLHLLIPRPLPQGEALRVALREKGFDGVCVPSIAINPITPSATTMQHWLQTQARYRVVIWTSVNSVRCLPARFWGELKNQALAHVAVGPSTARALKDEQQIAASIPNASNSESLLRYLVQNFDASLCQFLEIKGEGGRTYLQQNITAGCYQKLEVYQRTQVRTLDRSKLLVWQQSLQPMTLASSVQTIESLLKLLESKDQTRVLQSPILCPSQRVAKFVQDLGAKQAIVLSSIDDSSVVNFLLSKQTVSSH